VSGCHKQTRSEGFAFRVLGLEVIIFSSYYLLNVLLQIANKNGVKKKSTGTCQEADMLAIQGGGSRNSLILCNLKDTISVPLNAFGIYEGRVSLFFQ
jgi:hypothetical protein